LEANTAFEQSSLTKSALGFNGACYRFLPS
jgi:hypothetical protein